MPAEPEPPAPEPTESKDVFARLNQATAELQQHRLSHSEAAETFSKLLDSLPFGRLKCSALLNRARLGC